MHQVAQTNMSSLVGVYGQTQGLGSVQSKPNYAIPTGLDMNDKALASLHGLINELEQRFQPVLRIEPATDGQQSISNAPIAKQTVMARLEDIQKSIEFAQNRISEILRLLEV